jgi:glucokinase
MQTKADNVIGGVDLGGTHARIGVVEAHSNKILHTAKIKSASLTLDHFGDALEQTFGGFRDRLCGVGIGVTGFCDRAHRRVVTTCNFVPFLEDCNLADSIESRLKVPVRVDNDARVQVLAEFHFGSWGRPESLAVLTLGTGVGLAWMIDGRLYPPPDHGAMGGHMAVNISGNPCYCGIHGCLESGASGTAMAATANERIARYVPSALPRPATAEGICRTGFSDAVAKGCITAAIEYLRAGLHNLHHFYFPEVVVLSGGVAEGLWPYLSELQTWFAGMARYDGVRNRLVLSELGDDGGILGGAALFRTFDAVPVG